MIIVIRDWRKYVLEEKELRELEGWLYEYQWLDEDGALILDNLRFKGIELFKTTFGMYFNDLDKMIERGEKYE